LELLGHEELQTDGVVLKKVEAVVKVVPLVLQIFKGAPCPLIEPDDRADSFEVNIAVSEGYLILLLPDSLVFDIE